MKIQDFIAKKEIFVYGEGVPNFLGCNDINGLEVEKVYYFFFSSKTLRTIWLSSSCSKGLMIKASMLQS